MSKQMKSARLNRVTGLVGWLACCLFILIILGAARISGQSGESTPPGWVTENPGALKAQQVYARTPVTARHEHAEDASNGCPGQITLGGNWEMAEHRPPLSEYFRPTSISWFKVEMPKPVQSALMEAGKVPNLWYADNYKQLQWIQDRDWLLRRRFQIPQAWNGCTIRLRFDGLDYNGMVWLDGAFLGFHEGMFGGPTFDITAKATPGQEHELVVRLLHEEQDSSLLYYNPSRHGGKPSVMKADAYDGQSYIWGNRYRSMGLYQPVRLVATGQAYLEAPFVRTDRIGDREASLWAHRL